MLSLMHFLIIQEAMTPSGPCVPLVAGMYSSFLSQKLAFSHVGHYLQIVLRGLYLLSVMSYFYVMQNCFIKAVLMIP